MIPSVRAAGTLGAASETVELTCAGFASVAIQASDTWAGTLAFEVSVTKDTWTALNVTPPNSATSVTTSTANGLWLGSVAGIQAVRVRMSLFTSGRASLTLQAVPGGSAGVAAGGGGAVTIADNADVAQGATTDAAATDSTSAWSIVAILKGAWAKLAILAAQVLDYDTGAGTANQAIVGIALPASGGPVGVSATNPLPVISNVAATSTLSSVASSASSVTVLALNTARLGAIIYNDSTAILYLKFGTTASATSYTYQLAPGATVELPTLALYTGRIDGIWASANGNARVTEVTA